MIGVDLVPERLELARRHGVEVVDLRRTTTTSRATIRELTDGRGADSVIDAVGMEAHGSPGGRLLQTLAGCCPTSSREPLMEKVGVDRLAALHAAIDAVRRGGTLSIIGVYGGQADPMPMMDCSTSRSRSGWARRTSSAGSTT